MNQYNGNGSQRWGHITYAQHFDDGMLLNLIELLKIKKEETDALWLDLGCNHPFDISNTALLYDRGWRGTNVDANPNVMKDFEIYRPMDQNICCGVGPKEGEMTFYRFDPVSGLNTFSYDEMLSHQIVFGVTLMDTLQIHVKTLPQIVDLFCDGKYPPILLCDIEGLDLEVLTQLPRWDSSLETLKTSNIPKIICVETRHEYTKQMRGMLELRGFHLYCRMGANLFFVRNDYLGCIY